MAKVSGNWSFMSSFSIKLDKGFQEKLNSTLVSCGDWFLLDLTNQWLDTGTDALLDVFSMHHEEVTELGFEQNVVCEKGFDGWHPFSVFHSRNGRIVGEVE